MLKIKRQNYLSLIKEGKWRTFTQNGTEGKLSKKTYNLIKKIKNLPTISLYEFFLNQLITKLG